MEFDEILLAVVSLVQVYGVCLYDGIDVVIKV